MYYLLIFSSDARVKQWAAQLKVVLKSFFFSYLQNKHSDFIVTCQKPDAAIKVNKQLLVFRIESLKDQSTQALLWQNGA